MGACPPAFNPLLQAHNLFELLNPSVPLVTSQGRAVGFVSWVEARSPEGQTKGEQPSLSSRGGVGTSNRLSHGRAPWGLDEPHFWPRGAGHPVQLPLPSLVAAGQPCNYLWASVILAPQ